MFCCVGVRGIFGIVLMNGTKGKYGAEDVKMGLNLSALRSTFQKDDCIIGKKQNNNEHVKQPRDTLKEIRRTKESFYLHIWHQSARWIAPHFSPLNVLPLIRITANARLREWTTHVIVFILREDVT